MGARIRRRRSIRVKTNLCERPLPVRLAPCADELLSSWIARHAAFYAISPLAMLQHCLPELLSLRAADLNLTEDQVVRIAHIFSIEPTTVRRMTFSNIPQSSRRMIASEPRQSCSTCRRTADGLPVILRSQFLGWRITCPLCGGTLQTIGGNDGPTPFGGYHHAALMGEEMLDNEAEHGIPNWVSPNEIARLLLMRRVPKSVPGYEPSGYRLLGVIIPDLDDVMQMETSKLPSPASPILPMYLRPALLAGVAIVQHAGPEMLRMLSGHMMGENKARFDSAIEEILDCSRQSLGSSQLHLI
ncbi:TniQ family protein [Rhizobium sp. Root1203]|uniref:TniQ family protein n=1 Tax=Rhizobium sp. Root1203 TaxID=1736427 RepID=UPI0009ECA4FB|nr:TniQ family protein [Rhizobium sp. Root1203]